MKLRIFVATLLILGNFCAALEVPTTSSTRRQLVAERLQQELGLHGDTIPLDEIKNCIALAAQKKDVTDKALDALAFAMSNGANTQVLHERLFANITVDFKSMFDSPEAKAPSGTVVDRNNLGVMLYSRAKSLKNEDPKRAQAHARAGLLLIALDDYHSGFTRMEQITTDTELLAGLLNVEKKVAEDIHSLFAAAAKQHSADFDAMIVIWRSVDSVGLVKPQERQTVFENSIQLLDAAKLKGFATTSGDWQWANAYWTLRNWALAFDNRLTVTAIDKSLKEHANAAEVSDCLKKWIDESMKLTGKPARLLSEE